MGIRELFFVGIAALLWPAVPRASAALGPDEATPAGVPPGPERPCLTTRSPPWTSAGQRSNCAYESADEVPYRGPGPPGVGRSVPGRDRSRRLGGLDGLVLRPGWGAALMDLCDGSRRLRHGELHDGLVAGWSGSGGFEASVVRQRGGGRGGGGGGGGGDSGGSSGSALSQESTRGDVAKSALIGHGMR